MKKDNIKTYNMGLSKLKLDDFEVGFSSNWDIFRLEE